MRLSVIVTVVDGGDALRRCLHALASQRDPPEMEILVAWDQTLGDHAPFEAVCPAARFIQLGSLQTQRDPAGLAGQHELFDMRRAGALKCASGDVVAMLEDRGVPCPDWARTIVREHARPVAAIGGAVENGRDSILNWAVYYCDFGRYERPLPEGPAEYITDVNLSYKRAVLERTRPLWEHRYHETTVHWQLQREGEVLWLTPSFTVAQMRDGLRLHALLVERYYWARLFGFTRAREATLARRLLLSLATPVLPFLLFARLVRQRLQKRRNLGAFLRASPVTFLLLIAWVAGEAVGYATGRE